MNAFLALFAAATGAGLALIALNPSLALSLGRWLIAWAYSRRAARAEFDRCFRVWEGETPSAFLQEEEGAQ